MATKQSSLLPSKKSKGSYIGPFYPTKGGLPDKEGKYHTTLFYQDVEGNIRHKRTKSPIVDWFKISVNQTGNGLFFKFYQHVLADPDTIPDGYRITQAKFVDDTHVELFFDMYSVPVLQSAIRMFGLKPGTTTDGHVVNWNIMQDGYTGKWKVIQVNQDLDQMVVDIKPLQKKQRKKNAAYPGDPLSQSNRVGEFAVMSNDIRTGKIDITALATQLDKDVKALQLPIQYQGLVYSTNIPKAIIDIKGTGNWGPANPVTWDATNKLEGLIISYYKKYPGWFISWTDHSNTGLAPGFTRLGMSGKKKTKHNKSTQAKQTYSEAKIQRVMVYLDATLKDDDDTIHEICTEVKKRMKAGKQDTEIVDVIEDKARGDDTFINKVEHHVYKLLKE